MNAPLKPGLYRHYKGGIYRLVAVGKLEASQEAVAIYHSAAIGLTSGQGDWWVRPLSEFREKVEYQGREVDRFSFVSA